MIFFRLLFSITCSILILASCSSSDQNTNSSFCPQKDTTTKQSENIQVVKVFLELSGSMKGFMPKNIATDFKKNVPLFLTKMQNDLPLTRFEFIVVADAKSEFVDKDFKEAVNNIIAKGGVNDWTGSTYLPEMIEKINLLNDSNTLNLLITDAIYDPNNIDDANQEKRKILESINKSFETSIYALHSNFVTDQKSIPKSPYYFFAFGKEQNLKVIRPFIEEVFADTYDQVDFGFSETKPLYTILPYSENTGAGVPIICTEYNNVCIGFENFDASLNPEFWVGLDLTDCSPFINSENYLDINLNLDFTSGLKGEKKGKILTKSTFVEKLADDADEMKLFQNCTHFFKISIHEMYEPTGEITVSLKNEIPSWVESYSRPDSAMKRDKTFGLSDLISGINDVYKRKQTGYLFRNIKLILIK